MTYKNRTSEEKQNFAIAKVKALRPTEAAYLAGLLDSDGCIFATLRKDYKTGERKPHSSLYVVNTDKKMIDWVIAATGVGSCYQSLQNHRLHHGRKPIYRWDVSTRSAWVILRQVIDYLVIKREQAILLMELAELKMESTRFQPTDMTRQYEIVGEVQSLNRSGGKTGERSLITDRVIN